MDEGKYRTIWMQEFMNANSLISIVTIKNILGLSSGGALHHFCGVALGNFSQPILSRIIFQAAPLCSFARSVLKTRSDVIGNWRKVTPVAFLMALAIAPGTLTKPISPTPFAPKGCPRLPT